MYKPKMCSLDVTKEAVFTQQIILRAKNTQKVMKHLTVKPVPISLTVQEISLCVHSWTGSPILCVQLVGSFVDEILETITTSMLMTIMRKKTVRKFSIQPSNFSVVNTVRRVSQSAMFIRDN